MVRNDPYGCERSMLYLTDSGRAEMPTAMISLKCIRPINSEERLTRDFGVTKSS